MDKNLLVAIDHFNTDDDVISIHLFGEGHIHETYLVETQNHRPDYILQKINHNIFRDIAGMMQNIEAVTRHINRKLLDSPRHNPDRESLTLVSTRSGHSYFKDDDGNFWRMFTFIPDTVSYQIISDPDLALEAGKAIGKFQFILSDLESPLVETIPDFHNINLRISQFNSSRENDPANRLAEIPGDILFAEQRFEKMKDYLQALKDQAVLRATHNDTKLNNILFDQNKKALCLIDLDTVMQGYVHFDYGDALRTMANTAAEDEKDLTKVKFNREVYEEFTKGYLGSAGSFLTAAELALLPYAPVYLTFIIGLRFLTDYLNGDTYFRIHHPGHNLERARVQFKLVTEIEKTLNFYGTRMTRM
jgi:Ser/Thr protein kinase RdoA (MazF antagonist)